MKTSGAIVKCDKHGRHNPNNKTNEVKLNMPKNKRLRQSGCPMCRKGVPAIN